MNIRITEVWKNYGLCLLFKVFLWILLFNIFVSYWKQFFYYWQIHHFFLFLPLPTSPFFEKSMRWNACFWEIHEMKQCMYAWGITQVCCEREQIRRNIAWGQHLMCSLFLDLWGKMTGRIVFFMEYRVNISKIDKWEYLQYKP